MERHGIRERLVIRHRVALDGVRERVHARPGRHAGGQVDAQLRIDERHPGRDVRRAADVEFDFPVRVGDHRPERHLAAGPGGRGDGDQRRDARVDWILAPLVLHDAAPVNRDHADAFRGVDGATAADGDQPIAAL